MIPTGISIITTTMVVTMMAILLVSKQMDITLA